MLPSRYCAHCAAVCLPDVWRGGAGDCAQRPVRAPTLYHGPHVCKGPPLLVSHGQDCARLGIGTSCQLHDGLGRGVSPLVRKWLQLWENARGGSDDIEYTQLIRCCGITGAWVCTLILPGLAAASLVHILQPEPRSCLVMLSLALVYLLFMNVKRPGNILLPETLYRYCKQGLVFYCDNYRLVTTNLV